MAITNTLSVAATKRVMASDAIRSVNRDHVHPATPPDSVLLFYQRPLLVLQLAGYSGNERSRAS